MKLKLFFTYILVFLLMTNIVAFACPQPPIEIPVENPVDGTSLNLTPMCIVEEKADTHTRWRITNDSGVDVDYTYEVYGTGTMGNGTIAAEYTSAERFENPYYLEVPAAHGITLKIFWGDDREFSKSKASSGDICAIEEPEEPEEPEEEKPILNDNKYILSIDKTVNRELFEVGDTIIYNIIVKNIGNKNLTDVKIKDVLLDFEKTIDLQINEEVNYEIVVKAEDIGIITNIAEVFSPQASYKRDSETIEIIESTIVPEEPVEEPEEVVEEPEEEVVVEQPESEDIIEEPVYDENTPVELPNTGVVDLNLFYSLSALFSVGALIKFKK